MKNAMRIMERRIIERYHMKQVGLITVAAVSVAFVTVTLTGCRRQNEKESARAPAQEATPSKEVSKDIAKRSELPFQYDCKISGLIVSGTFSFDKSMNATPTKQTHPGGTISAFTCDGVAIELTRGEIVDGMIETKDFGSIEVFSSPHGVDLYGTESQSRAIAKFIKNAGKK